MAKISAGNEQPTFGQSPAEQQDECETNWGVAGAFAGSAGGLAEGLAAEQVEDLEADVHRVPSRVDRERLACGGPCGVLVVSGLEEPNGP